MVYDSLTSLVESARSVFQPRNENDINSFENFIFNNYITDMEGEEENSEEQTDQVNCSVDLSLNNSQNRKRSKTSHSGRRLNAADTKLYRTSMIELSPIHCEEKSNLHRFSSMQ